MTKADVINAIVAQTGIGKNDAIIAVEAFMNVVKKTMAEEKENVFLRGFGTFVVKRRAEKLARDISKNTTVTIPEHDYPTFRPAKAFLDEMNR